MNTNAKVEDFFIGPLEAHFESQPTDGQRETILSDLHEFTAEQLFEAAEWLKRARQSAKTFPAPKECLKAIQAVLSGAGKPLTNRPATDFTHAQTYGQKLKVWVEARGGAVAITRCSHEWTEWEIYFLATGNKVQYPAMEGKGEWTVPTRLPQQFDPNYDWALGSRLLRDKNKTDMGEDAFKRKANVQRILSGLNIKGSDDKSKRETASAGWQQKVDDRWAPSGSLADRLGL